MNEERGRTKIQKIGPGYHERLLRRHHILGVLESGEACGPAVAADLCLGHLYCYIGPGGDEFL